MTVVLVLFKVLWYSLFLRTGQFFVLRFHCGHGRHGVFTAVLFIASVLLSRFISLLPRILVSEQNPSVSV